MKIKIVVGEICSGKSSYIQKLRLKACNENVSFTKIDIGDIVREITATENRVFDQDLDTHIISKVNDIIDQEINLKTGLLVIGGIRQKSILDAITSMCDVEKISITELQASNDTRKARYERRDAEKDLLISFEDADKKDKQLGLTDLITYIRTQIKMPLLIINTN